MTKEEREKRKREHIARREQEIKDFPEFFLSEENGGSCLQIIMEEGSRWFIEIRARDLSMFCKERESSYVRASIKIDDIGSLSDLIHALSCRLNYMIREANDTIVKCGLVKLETLPTETETA